MTGVSYIVRYTVSPMLASAKRVSGQFSIRPKTRLRSAWLMRCVMRSW